MNAVICFPLCQALKHFLVYFVFENVANKQKKDSETKLNKTIKYTTNKRYKVNFILSLTALNIYHLEKSSVSPYKVVNPTIPEFLYKTSNKSENPTSKIASYMLLGCLYITIQLGRRINSA